MTAIVAPLIFLVMAVLSGCAVGWILRAGAVIVQGQLYRRETHPVGFWGAVVGLSVSCLANLGMAAWVAQLTWMEQQGFK